MVRLKNKCNKQFYITPALAPLGNYVVIGQGREDSERRNRQAGEKALDLPARSPALRDEGRAEPPQ